MTAGLTRKEKLDLERARRAREQQSPEGSIWDNLLPRISQGLVIPIISNALSYESIFADMAPDKSDPDPEEDFVGPGLRVRPIDFLSELWGIEVGYPLPDSYELARVAQYHFSKKKFAEEGMTDFLTFLKTRLFEYAAEHGVKENTLAPLRRQAATSTFSFLAGELDYPYFEPGHEDPLRMLARLPLRMFVTTSYHNFLERALEAEKKKPISLYCDWNRPEGAPFEEASLTPTEMEPLVYHLFGIEEVPVSMIFSEEDYLGFLVRFAQTESSDRPIVPANIIAALKRSTLLLLGYRLTDWDFRVLLRGVLEADKESSRIYSRIVQLNPEQQFLIEDKDEARHYLESYFGGEARKFGVSWCKPEAFISDLWAEWDRWRK